MLYQFESLSRKLDEWRFPAIQGSTGFQVIKGIDFETAYKSGSISFEDDGIYLEHEGKKYRGYMFIQEPRISDKGWYPKFHLKKCTTIQEFIQIGQFRIRYEWSNSNVNDLIDLNTRQVYENETLSYCQNCRKEFYNGIKTTGDFFDSLDKTKIKTEDVEVYINGYPRNWEKISKNYRTLKGYACESCGIAPINVLDRRHWHTHHKDGDKTNNKESNLECLCVLCHSYKDLKHEENFDTKRMRKELDAFVEQYRSELILLRNLYLAIYENEKK